MAQNIVETIAVYLRRTTVRPGRPRRMVLTEEDVVRTLVCVAVMLGIGGLIWIAAVLLAGYER